MAFTRSNGGAQSSAGPAASLVLTGQGASIGDIFVVAVAAANSGTSGTAVTTTCTDSAGNTYTQRSQVNNTAGVVDDGITLTVFTSKITNTLVSGSVTVSFSPSSAQGCGMTVKKYHPAAGETAFYITAGAGATGNSAAPSITAASVAALDTIIGCIAEEAGTTINEDSDTTNGTWNTKFEVALGSGNTAAHVLTQDKDTTATGAQTFNVTTSVAHDYAINYIVIRAFGTVVAGAGAYAVTGTAASLKIFPPHVSATPGSYAVTGTAAGLIKTTTVVPVITSYVVTGQAATLARSSVGRSIAASAGSYAVTGAVATLKAGRKVVAAVSSYAVTGTAASLKRGKTIAAAASSYAVIGTAATLKEGRKAAAAVGAYAATGTAATLIRTGVGARILPAASGSYSVSGSTAGLLRSRKAVAAASSYAVTGTAASLKYGRKTAAAVSSYAATGIAASLRHGWKVAATTASYSATGADAVLRISGHFVVGASAGGYLVTGAAASLMRSRLLTSEVGTYAVVGQAVPLTSVTRRKRVASSSLKDARETLRPSQLSQGDRVGIQPSYISRRNVG